MLLSALTVRDFRGFATFDLELAPDVTVLVGVNGAGKTSLLDATALMLSYLVASVRTGRANGTRLSAADIRVGAPSASLTLAAEIDGPPAITWTVKSTRTGYPTTERSSLEELNGAAARIKQGVAEDAPRLPLAVYFPTNRSALDIPERIRKPHEFDVMSAYTGALQGGASNFRGFFEWYRAEEDVYNEQALRPDAGQDKMRSSLPEVRRAIESCGSSADPNG